MQGGYLWGAVWYNTGLLNKLTPKGVVFSFLFQGDYHTKRYKWLQLLTGAFQTPLP